MDVTRLDMPRTSEVPEVRVSRTREQVRERKTPAGGAEEAEPRRRSLGPQEMESSLESLASQVNLKVEQTTDEKSGHKVVRIFTRDGERLLRQMPPEAALRILQEVAAGGEGLLSSVI